MTEKKYKKTLFGLVTALFWFSLYVYIPVFPTYMENLGVSHGMIGIVLGSYGFVQMLLRIPLGILSDRINKRKVFVILGVILGTSSAVGLAFLENPYLILLMRSLSGAAAATWVTYTILFSSYFRQEDTSKAIGIINSYTKIGQVAAMLLGGFIAQFLGTRSPFLLAAFGGIIGIVLSLGIDKKEDLERKPLKTDQLLQVAKDFNLLSVSFLAILVQLITFATIFGFNPVIARNIGASDTQLGLLATLSNVPTIPAAVLAGTFFTDLIGERKTIIAGFIVVALTTVIVPYINNLNLLFLSQIIGGFGRGLIYPLLMALSIKEIKDNQRATAMGFFQAIYGIGMFIGPVIVGFISDYAGLTAGFWFVTFVSVGAAILSRFLIKQKAF